jgi:hypothetical protein
MKHEGGHEDCYLGGVVPWQLHDKSPMSKKRLIAIASGSGGCKKIAIVVVAPVVE